MYTAPESSPCFIRDLELITVLFSSEHCVSTLQTKERICPMSVAQKAWGRRLQPSDIIWKHSIKHHSPNSLGGMESSGEDGVCGNTLLTQESSWFTSTVLHRKTQVPAAIDWGSRHDLGEGSYGAGRAFCPSVATESHPCMSRCTATVGGKKLSTMAIFFKSLNNLVL